MENIPILTIEDVAQIDQVLLDYLDKSEATLAVVIDKGGNILSQQGDYGNSDTTIVAALAAGSFAATKELARRIGEPEFSALYHQGKGSHIFMNAIDEDSILITVFGEQTTVGLVRFYTVNAASQLAQILHSLRTKPRDNTMTFTSTDVEQALSGN